MPAWAAVSAQVPTPTMVRVLPDTVQMLARLLVEKVKAVRPLEAVADKVIGATPKTTGEAGVKVTVWVIGAMTRLYALNPVKPLASVAVTEKLNVPPAVAVPLRSPPLESVRPPGSAPVVTAKECGTTPPLAVIVVDIYALLNVPPGRVAGDRVIVGAFTTCPPASVPLLTPLVVSPL